MKDTQYPMTALREILSDLQQQTIIIDVKGSVLGPEEDARAFRASLDTAEAAVRELWNAACTKREQLAVMRAFQKHHEQYPDCPPRLLAQPPQETGEAT